MTFLYYLIPFVLIIGVCGIQTILAKREIIDFKERNDSTFIDNVEGSYFYTGLKVFLPQGKLELYLTDDLILITGKANVLWLFKMQYRPLIIKRKGMEHEERNNEFQQIDSFDIIGSKIKLKINVKGLSKVEYMFGVKREGLESDKIKLKEWFE